MLKIDIKTAWKLSIYQVNRLIEIHTKYLSGGKSTSTTLLDDIDIALGGG